MTSMWSEFLLLNSWPILASYITCTVRNTGLTLCQSNLHFWYTKFEFYVFILSQSKMYMNDNPPTCTWTLEIQYVNQNVWTYTISLFQTQLSQKSYWPTLSSCLTLPSPTLESIPTVYQTRPHTTGNMTSRSYITW